MPNFIITNVCNLSCEFCFASEHMDGEVNGSAGRMSVEELRRQLDFIGDQAARFCGGEPTLHPDFIEMLRLALSRPGRPVFIMTNGVWPKPVREFIAGLGFFERRRLGFLFNVLPVASYKPEQERALHETLAMVRKEHATLGVTLHRREHDTAYLFALAERFDFKRIRYSVASPNVSDPRSWLVDPNTDFVALASVVHAMTMEARRRGIFIHSDCGYLPPCVFTPEQLAELYPRDDAQKRSAFSCNGPVDIGPGGEAWRCYGLYSTMRERTADYPNSAALGEAFETRTQTTQFAPLYAACASCELKERYHCAGGCYALRSVEGLQRRAADDGLVQIGSSAALARAVPRLRDGVVVLGAQDAAMVQEDDGTWSKVPLSAWEAALLAACDGTREADAVVAAVARPAHTPEEAGARVLRRLYERGVLELGTPRPRGGEA